MSGSELDVVGLVSAAWQKSHFVILFFSRRHGLPPRQDVGVWSCCGAGEWSADGALVEGALADGDGADWQGGDCLCSGFAGDEGKCGEQRKISVDAAAAEDGS